MKYQKLTRLLFVATFYLLVGIIQTQEMHVRQLKLNSGLSIIQNEDNSKTEMFEMVVVNTYQLKAYPTHMIIGKHSNIACKNTGFGSQTVSDLDQHIRID